MLDNYGKHVQFLEPRVVEYHDPGASAHGLSAERWNTYERLLRRVGTRRNVWNTGDGIVLQQYVAKFGPTDSRWMRGYYYARGPVPSRLTETSDLVADSTWSARGRWERPLYRPIEAEWYLYADKGYSD